MENIWEGSQAARGTPESSNINPFLLIDQPFLGGSSVLGGCLMLAPAAWTSEKSTPEEMKWHMVMRPGQPPAPRTTSEDGTHCVEPLTWENAVKTSMDHTKRDHSKAAEDSAVMERSSSRLRSSWKAGEGELKRRPRLPADSGKTSSSRLTPTSQTYSSTQEVARHPEVARHLTSRSFLFPDLLPSRSSSTS